MIVALVSLIIILALSFVGVVIWWHFKERKIFMAQVREKRHELDRNQDSLSKNIAEIRSELRQERETILKHYIDAITAMTSYGRYELDAGERALKMQQIIDQRVKERTIAVKVDQAGNVLVDRAQHAEPGEQPPDPNVRSSSIVDEVHEYERDLARIVNDNYDYEKRDTGYQEQPIMEA